MGGNNKWWQNTVVYQIYCKSFCDSNGDGIGDLQGVISKLDMLKDLGVGCIWFNPIFKSPQFDNGYDVSDFTDIEPSYGNLADFKELLEKAHSLGIRIILDFVMNHTSVEHPWFKKSRSAKENNPYRDYYVWRNPKENGKEPNNWGNYFYEGKGSAWQFDEKTGQYYLHNYSWRMPDLNWEYKPLREEMYRVMRFWLDLGVDGLRLDAVNRLKKPEGLPDSLKPPTPPVGIYGYVVDRTICCNVPGIHELLQEINREVWSKYDCFTVGECGNLSSDGALDYISANRHEINALFHFEIGKNPEHITALKYKETQSRWIELLKHNAWITQFLSNHDTPRQVSKLGDDGRYRVESAKLLGTLTHTMPGTPFIYQGEELGMTNVDFPSIDDYNDRYMIGKYHTMIEAGESPEKALSALKLLSRDNVRTPYQWDGSKNAGFTTGKPWIKVNPNFHEINYELQKNNEASVFTWYRNLIKLRYEHSAVVNGDFRFISPDDADMIIYERKTDNDALLVIANFSDKEILCNRLSKEFISDKWKPVMSNYEGLEPSLTGSRKLWQPWEVEVYSLR